MSVDPTLAAALRHWGARSVPFSDTPGEAPFLHPSWEQAARLLQQTAALRSLMLLCGDNGVGKSALVGHWLQSLEPKAYLPLVITQATLSGNGLLAVLLNRLGQNRASFAAAISAAWKRPSKTWAGSLPCWCSTRPSIIPPEHSRKCACFSGSIFPASQSSPWF